MKIITIPHQTLRQTAQIVSEVTPLVIKFIQNLENTLDGTQNPPGVGLAAPQVDKLLRVFTTNFPQEDSRQKKKERIRHFINPVISKACKRKKVFGVDPKDPDLEGCLSLPGLYGAVPRHRWVELEFQTLENGKLIEHKERFDNFDARVIQHELDHLDGILFTDYSLEYELPVYRQSEHGKNLVEVDRSFIEVI